MKQNYVFVLIGMGILLVGICYITFQIYKMTVIDASARGLKHPKGWGLFAMNNNNGSGLILYLIGRRKYPIIEISKQDQEEICLRKRRTFVGILFLIVGGITTITSLFLMK